MAVLLFVVVCPAAGMLTTNLMYRQNARKPIKFEIVFSSFYILFPCLLELEITFFKDLSYIKAFVWSIYNTLHQGGLTDAQVIQNHV